MMKSKWSLVFLAGLALAVGCAGDPGADGDGGGTQPQPGNAYLTIVGEANVFLENGWQQTLTVEYHDGDGMALAGLVEFSVVGNSGGATISADASATGQGGVATTHLTAGAEGEAVFRIRATAEYADAVEWTVSVSRGQPPLPALDPTGRYNVHSEFDLASGLPGTVGAVVNGFIDMTDSPYDPATWLIDLALDEITSSTIKNLVSAARPALDAVVNDLILSLAPDFVVDILDIGDKFGQVARNFGTISTLEVQAVDGIEGAELVATHILTGVFFDIDGQRFTFPMADLGMQNLKVEEIAFTLEGETKVGIGEHAFPLSYGTLLLVALDKVIIPLVDPNAKDLYDLLANLVDCQAVGVTIADYVGFGSPSLYQGACELGTAAAAGVLIDQIASLDGSALVLAIRGEARPQDTNTDRKVDLLLGGEWFGDVSYAGQPVTLSGATFRGERMALP